MVGRMDTKILQMEDLKHTGTDQQKKLRTMMMLMMMMMMMTKMKMVNLVLQPFVKYFAV